MKLNLKALALAVGILWGSGILLVSIGNMIFPPYGAAFLQTVASVYPFYDPASGGVSVVVGALLGFVDGAIAGFLLGWLYNRFSG